MERPTSTRWCLLDRVGGGMRLGTLSMISITSHRLLAMLLACYCWTTTSHRTAVGAVIF